MNQLMKRLERVQASNQRLIENNNEIELLTRLNQEIDARLDEIENNKKIIEKKLKEI